MDDINERLVQAVKGWGQEPSWQIKVLDVLGTKADLVKLWFIRAPGQSTAIAAANELLAEDKRLTCHGDPPGPAVPPCNKPATAGECTVQVCVHRI